MRALFVGRFQPFHLGHFLVVRDICNEFDELVIVIGSSQESYTFRNPFTAGERVEMIGRVIQKNFRDKTIYLIPVPDILNNNLWVAHLESLTPRFSVVFTRNPLVKKLFEVRGYKVVEQKFYKGYSASDIRKRIANNREWKNLVPDEVYKYIEEIGGEERIKDLKNIERC